MAPVNTQLWSVGGTRWGFNDVRDYSDNTVLKSTEWHCIEYMTTWDYRWKVGEKWDGTIIYLEAVSTFFCVCVCFPSFPQVCSQFFSVSKIWTWKQLFNGKSYSVGPWKRTVVLPNFVGFQRTPNWFWAWRKPKSTSAASRKMNDREGYPPDN